MCGHVGVIGNLWERHKKAFEMMLKLDTIRGPHSTGIATITEDCKINVVKGVGTPWDLIKEKGNEFYNGANHKAIQGNFKALIGHNRWATVGDVVEKNAHPFHVGSVVGAHNGTLHQVSTRKLFHNEKVDTDSEAIMCNLNENGVNDTFDKLEGAWALIWYDSTDDSLNIVRNKERPLYYSWNKKGDVLMYASEPFMIFEAAERYDIELADEQRVFPFAVDTHYKYTLGRSINFSDKNLETSERKGYQPPKYEPTYRVVSQGGSGNLFKQSSDESGMKPADLALYWAERKDKYVEFKLGGGWKEDEQRKKYVQCFTLFNKTEVRIYPSNRDLLPFLGDDNALSFIAKVNKTKFLKKNSGRSTVYITIDAESFDIAAMKNVDDEIFWAGVFANSGEITGEIVGPNNKEVTEKEYKDLTCKGCCWCSYQPSYEEANKLFWIQGTQEFLCADCKENPDVQQYANYLV